MKPIRSLVWFAAVFASAVFAIGAEGAPRDAHEALRTELSKKLADLGSVQMEYLAVASDKPSMNITFVVDHRRQYFLIKIVGGPQAVRGNYIVVDYSEVKDGKQQLRLLMIDGSEGEEGRLSLQDALSRIDNPAGMLVLMLRSFEEESKKKTSGAPDRLSAPSLSLSLDPESLELGFGLSTKGKSLGTSWLEKDSWSRAEKVVVSREVVLLDYGSNHVVTINRRTGLLEKDSFPNPLRPGPREVVLKSHSKLGRGTPYSELIPGFDAVRFREAPSERLYRIFSDIFIAELGALLAGIDGFDRNLQEHSPGIAAAVRNRAREGARETAREKLKALSPELHRLKEESLMPAYKKFLESHPDQAGKTSFSKFVDAAMREFEKDPSKLVPANIAASLEGLKTDCWNAILRVPEPSRDPLRKLFDVGMPAMIEGMMLGFVEETAERVKDLE